MIATGASSRYAKRAFADAAKVPKDRTSEKTLAQEDEAEVQKRLERMRVLLPLDLQTS